MLTLVGWAADGFPMYARWDYSDAKDATEHNARDEIELPDQAGHAPRWTRVENTTAPTSPTMNMSAGSGDLDECGGRFGVTPENPDGIYHYVLTDDYPFIPRIYKGTPDCELSSVVDLRPAVVAPEAVADRLEVFLRRVFHRLRADDLCGTV